MEVSTEVSEQPQWSATGGSRSKLPAELNLFGTFCPTWKPYRIGPRSKAWVGIRPLSPICAHGYAILALLSFHAVGDAADGNKVAEACIKLSSLIVEMS
jgi:hypothetical protein